MQSCSPSTSSGEVFSGSDASSDNSGKTPDPWFAFNAAAIAGLPLVPKLPVLTAAVPFVPSRCTVADMRNLQVSAQLVSAQLWLDPILNRQASSPRSARNILGLEGSPSSSSTSEAGTAVSEVVRDPPAMLAQVPSVPSAPARPPPPSRAPIVNRWLSKHPILGSVLTPTESVSTEPPPRKVQAVLTDVACSPRHSPLKSPVRGEALGGGEESSELISLVRQLAEDAKKRAAAEEERANRERSERQETSAAVEAAALAAKEAALRCQAVQEEARQQASVIAAATEEEKSRQRKIAEAHRHTVLLGAMARWSDSNASVFVRCVLQAWLETVVANRAEARMSDACAQTDADKQQEWPEECKEDLEACLDDPPAIIPGGFLRALQGEQVWLDVKTGAVSGASLWLSQKPPQASQDFVRTFDICLPWCEASAQVGSEAASSTTTVDPLCLGEEQLLAPGPLLRSELLSLPMSPLHSRLPSPTSRAGTPKSLAASRGRSPMGSIGRRTPLQSPQAASEARMALDDDDEITPEKVLRRISGLMSEMTAMEVSLGNLRQELDAGTEDGDGVDLASKITEGLTTEVSLQPHSGRSARRVPLRLRQPMPESLSWLQSTSRPMRASSAAAPAGHGGVRTQSSGPRVSLDARHTLGRNSGLRGRPPSKVGQPRAGVRRRSASGTRRPHLAQGQHRHSIPADAWTRSVPM